MLLAVVLANGLEAEWREVSIRFIVREDAALQMTEWGVLEVPPLATGVERTYFTDDEQRLTFDGVLIDGVDVALDTTTPGTVTRRDLVVPSVWKECNARSIAEL